MKRILKRYQNYMRKVFFKVLEELAAKDGKVIFLTGDVGFSYSESFAAKYPNQYLNCGITEQTMMGIAAGLAYTGWKPYVYSMANFVIFRAYEQLRGDVCYTNANVKIIGVRGGDSYKHLGYMHNISENEDAKVLVSLPNIDIRIPDSEDSLMNDLLQTYESGVPTYIRL